MDIPGLAGFFDAGGGNRKLLTTPLKHLEMKKSLKPMFSVTHNPCSGNRKGLSHCASITGLLTPTASR
jgi:hypothetical protein